MPVACDGQPMPLSFIVLFRALLPPFASLPFPNADLLPAWGSLTHPGHSGSCQGAGQGAGGGWGEMTAGAPHADVGDGVWGSSLVGG